MNFVQNLFKRMEYGDYEPVAKYGQVFAATMGNEAFTMGSQLLRGKSDWVLRLDLNRRWGGSGNRTLIDLHFHTLRELATPFATLLQDVQTGVTEANTAPKGGLFQKAIIDAAAGKIVRAYGRIDHHPKSSAQSRVELFLAWNGQSYWLLLCEGEGSVEWSKWPVGIVNALRRLLPQLEAAIGSYPYKFGE